MVEDTSVWKHPNTSGHMLSDTARLCLSVAIQTSRFVNRTDNIPLCMRKASYAIICITHSFRFSIFVIPWPGFRTSVWHPFSVSCNIYLIFLFNLTLYYQVSLNTMYLRQKKWLVLKIIIFTVYFLNCKNTFATIASNSWVPEVKSPSIFSIG